LRQVRLPLVLLTAAAAGLFALSVWLLELSVERSLLLAPVLVAGAGAIVALAVLWTRIAYESLRRQRHPLRIVAGGAAVLALLVVLSFFVELPSGH
jgi:hypothetical protein